MIRALQITPVGNGQAWLDSHGGEIAFEGDVDGQKLAVARIIAVTTKIGPDVSVVVRVPGEFAGQLRAGETVQVLPCLQVQGARQPFCCRSRND